MPPILALMICILFVAVLLRVEHKRSAGLSWAVWVPTLWMLYCSSKSVSEWFGISQADLSVETGNPVERTVLTLFIALGLGILASRSNSINWWRTVRDNRWLLVLFTYMLISILWSDFPYVSFKRWVRTAGSLVMALVVLTEAMPYEAMRSVFVRTVYILIPFSVVLVKYFRRFGVDFGRWSGGTMWIGATIGKNCLGVLCLISAFFIVGMLARRWQGTEPYKIRHQTIADLLVLCLTFWLIRGPGGAYSATSIVALVVGLAVFLILRRLNSNGRRLDALIRAAFLGAFIILLLVKLFDFSPMKLVASATGRTETLTGRSDMIWSVLVPLAWKNPVLGVGYGAFWVKQPPGLTFEINEAHNGYLDVFIELGAVGLTLLLILLVSYLKKARAEFAHNPDWAGFRISCLLVLLLHNVTETDFLRSTFPLWNLFVFLMIVYPTRPAGKQGIRIS